MFAGQQCKKCEHCKSPLHFFCTSCDFGLCGGCVIMHLLSRTKKRHNIVNYRDRYSGKRATGFCEIHDNNEREFVCTYCEETLCPNCVPRHTKMACNITKIKDFVRGKLNHINEQNYFLSKIRLDLKSMIIKARNNILKSDLGISESEIDMYKKKWYGNIDKIVEGLKWYRRKLYEKGHKRLIKNLLRLEKLYFQTGITLQENREKLFNPDYMVSSSPPCQDKSGIVDMELSIQKEMSEFKKKISKIDKQLNNAVGELKEEKLLDDISIQETQTYLILGKLQFQKPSMIPLAISCRSPNVVLISSSLQNDSEILKIDHAGKLLKKRTIKFKVDRMAMLQSGDVLCLHGNTIMKVSEDLTKLWKRLDEEWKTSDITISPSDEVYACQCMQEWLLGRVVIWDKNGKTKQIIDGQIHSYHNKYKNPSHIRINGNNDICVIDAQTHSLIVTNNMGIRRFVYIAAFGDIDGLATNSQYHIFLGEGEGIHELDANGKHLRFLFDKRFTFSRIFDIDDDDNMWIINLHLGKHFRNMMKIVFKV